MARKSRKVDYVNVGNKENLVTEAENQCEKVSHAALYARLSYESEKNREREVERIEERINEYQREVLDGIRRYCERGDAYNRRCQ